MSVSQFRCDCEVIGWGSGRSARSVPPRWRARRGGLIFRTMASHFDEIGGEPVLRAIIEDFVGRLFDDAMIGFFFARVSRPRLEKFEYQHAAELLGADVTYGGRSLSEAHARHPIMGGQFDRRKQILRNTLVDHGVPQHVQQAWLDHVESLRPLITRDAAGECIDPRSRGSR